MLDKISPVASRRVPTGRLAVILVMTFLLALAVTAQIKAALIPTSNNVARNQALAKSVQDLEGQNVRLRGDVLATNGEISQLNQQLARLSAAAGSIQDLTQAEKETAGLAAVQGPGIAIDLQSGANPHNRNDLKQDWLVHYQDIQDIVNLLWASGAEAISVNHQRIVATSGFYAAGSDILLNGVQLTSPYHLESIGDASRMGDALGKDNDLTELKDRSNLYQLGLKWTAQRRLRLPAYEGAFVVRFAIAGA